MVFSLIIGLIFLAAAAALIARAVTIGRLRVEAHVRQIDAYGFKDGSDEALALVAPPRWSQLNGLAERVGRFAEVNVPRLTPMPRKELTAAGFYLITADAFHGYRVLAGVSLPALEILNSLLSGRSLFIGILLAALFGVFGYFGPMAYVQARGRRRLDRIDRDLPELIDLLTVTVESGLSFAGSLQMVTSRFTGPLGEEMRLTLQEQTMGLSTEQALDNMLERCETPAIRAFVRAVRQAETLGISIGQMLRNLAIEARLRRRQRAREKVQKAPVKLLFPLVFMIFPAMLIVLLYPAVHQITTQLGHH